MTALPHLSLPCLTFCVPAHADKLRTASAPGTGVSTVQHITPEPQISDAVIVADAVDVIYQGRGPLAIVDQPNQPMHKPQALPELDIPVSVSVQTASLSAHNHASRGPLGPNQPAGLRIIPEIVETFGCRQVIRCDCNHLHTHPDVAARRRTPIRRSDSGGFRLHLTQPHRQGSPRVGRV